MASGGIGGCARDCPASVNHNALAGEAFRIAWPSQPVHQRPARSGSAKSSAVPWPRTALSRCSCTPRPASSRMLRRRRDPRCWPRARPPAGPAFSSPRRRGAARGSRATGEIIATRGTGGASAAASAARVAPSEAPTTPADRPDVRPRWRATRRPPARPQPSARKPRHFRRTAMSPQVHGERRHTRCPGVARHGRPLVLRTAQHVHEDHRRRRRGRPRRTSPASVVPSGPVT